MDFIIHSYFIFSIFYVTNLWQLYFKFICHLNIEQFVFFKLFYYNLILSICIFSLNICMYVYFFVFIYVCIYFIYLYILCFCFFIIKKPYLFRKSYICCCIDGMHIIYVCVYIFACNLPYQMQCAIQPHLNLAPY